MTRDAILAQALAIRAQVDALVAMVSGGVEDEGCPHPHDHRVDMTEMGGPIRFLCRACGETITLMDEGDDDAGA